MGTLRIGIDARLTYYRVGGISTYITQLVAALERIADPHTQFTVFHSRKSPVENRVGTRFARANLWTPSHHRLERWALSVELAPYRLDVFHSTDFIPPVRGAKRHIISVHDLNFLHYPHFLTEESRRYYNDQIAYAVAHADHILTISESSKADLIQLLHVPADKITVTPLAADERFRPISAAEEVQARKALNLPERYLLYFGTFEPRKNLDGLARAYAILKERFPGAPVLILAGRRGWLFDEIRASIDALGLGSSIQFREDIPQDAAPALYSLATALVMPSHYEGFGLPALEAMACGTVPIVSNRSSLPEVVGSVGRMVDPDDSAMIADAMFQACTDSSWRAEQEALGLHRASQFTWAKVAQTTLRVYQGIQ